MVRSYFPPANQLTEPSPPLVMRIAAFYAQQFFFVKRMKRFIWISGLLFLLTVVLGIAFFLLNRELALRWVSDFSDRYIRDHPRLATPWGEFLFIYSNNLRVAFMICLAGLIPFFLPSVVLLIANAGVLSLLLASAWIKGEPVLMMFSTMILPHGIVELPAIVFAAGFSLYVSMQMTKRLFRKMGTQKIRREGLFGFMMQDDLPDRLEALGDIVRFFAGVILPLLLIAALLETFVTPIIYRLFA